MRKRRALALAIFAATPLLAACGSSSSSGSSTSSSATKSTVAFIAPLTGVTKVASTVPANGDVNPYGIAVAPTSTGKLVAGNMLVSNFNDKENNQGTGTTIMQISPTGKTSLFAGIDAKSLPGPCPGGVGLTTALSILPGGYVVVGSLPTTNGKTATAKNGCLIVLDSNGHPVSTIQSANIQGPWDMTSKSEGAKTMLFVSNALNGGAKAGAHKNPNSTVLRIELESGENQAPKVLHETVIGNGIPWENSPTALVLGPTGLALSSNGTLYVAQTLGNKITSIPEASTRTTPAAGGGTTVSEGEHLKEPLGMVLAPNGNIVTTNGGDGNMVETTPTGKQVAVQTADSEAGAGTLFGLVVVGSHIYYTDDGDNTLRLLH